LKTLFLKRSNKANRRDRGARRKIFDLSLFFSALSAPSAVSIGILLLVFIGSVIFVNPLYNYPVGDDWTYALSVKHLYETGSLRLADESAASLLFQVIWGYVFCLPFGFSYAALHVSTLVLSFAGLLSFYKLCELVIAATGSLKGKSYWLPLIATLTVWFSPVYFTLSFTFFTDAPFYSLVILSLYFFVKGEEGNRPVEVEGPSHKGTTRFVWGDTHWFILAAVFSCCAVLVRQYAILLPFMVLLLIATRQWPTKRRRLKMALLALPFVVLVGFYYWLVKFHGVPTQFRFAQLEMLKSYRIAHDLYHLPFIALFYAGLYGLPITLAVFTSWRTLPRKDNVPVNSSDTRGEPAGFTLRGRIGKPFTLTLVALLGYAAYAYFTERRLMPYLTDSAITPQFGPSVSVALTILSAFSGALIVHIVDYRAREWVRGLLARYARIIGVIAFAALLGSALLASDTGEDFLLRQLEDAITAYYRSYTSQIPANQSLDYWRGRVGEFYIGAKQIVYGVALLGVILSFFAIRSRIHRRGAESAEIAKGVDLKLSFALGVLFVAFFILISCRFDRYIFIIFPILLAACLKYLAVGFNVRAAAVTVTVFAVVGLASTKTMINSYGALWTAGNELLVRGVPIEEMSINYTFDAYSLYLAGKRDIKKTGNPSYWAYASRRDPKYITSKPLGDARLILEVPYTDYLRLRIERVQVWMRDSGEPGNQTVVK